MRILVLFGNIPLLGKERGNIQALRALRDQGHSVLFATNKALGHLHIHPFLDELGLPWRPVTVVAPFRRSTGPVEALARAGHLVRAWKELYAVIREYRPTHIHAMNAWQYLYSLPVVVAAGVPVVYRLGDNTPSPYHRPWQVVWKYVVAPTVSQFVCISEYIRGRLLAIGTPPEKSRVIYNYPPERPAPARPYEGEAFAGRTVVYAGQIAPYKGVDHLVEAALRLCRERDDVRFLIAGNAESAFAQGLIARVGAAGLSERVRFLGYVEDVDGLLRTADVHACPSVKEEPLGNVVVEAKRAGVPTVAFPSGGIPEIIEDGVDGVVCAAKTAEALEAGLRRYLDADAAELARAKAAARASLERLGITREAFTEAWAGVYASA
ncbi:MAG: glycosyltransferase family 4 protein [Rhodothermales bacterium]|nr:glycosyltransferase family 4 protein [Rhodothermales bacterium]